MSTASSNSNPNKWSGQEVDDFHEALRICDEPQAVVEFMRKAGHPDRGYGAYEFRLRNLLPVWKDVPEKLYKLIRIEKSREEHARRAKEAATKTNSPKPTVEPNTADSAGEWLTINELEKVCGYTSAAIYMLSKNGSIAFRDTQERGRNRYSVTSLRAFMATCSIAPLIPQRSSPRIVAYDALLDECSRRQSQTVSPNEAAFVLGLNGDHNRSALTHRGLINSEGVVPVAKLDKEVNALGLRRMREWERMGFKFGAPYDSQPGVAVGSEFRAATPPTAFDLHRSEIRMDPIQVKSAEAASLAPKALRPATPPGRPAVDAPVTDAIADPTSWIAQGINSGMLTRAEGERLMLDRLNQALKRRA